MDPLSITASIIAVLQLTATVVNYLNGVKNASEGQRQCAIEASNVFALLTSLKYRLEEANPTDPWYARVRALAIENGPLSQYRTALERLVAKISPRDGVPKVVATLLWPFSKEEVSATFATIERLKSLVSIALEMDHFKLSQAIKNETQHIPGLVQDLGAIRRNQDDQQSKTIIDWLSTTDFANQQADISLKRQAGTGTWFLESPAFVDWLNGLNATLFCPGIPGAGKTMLSSLAIDHLRTVSHQRGAGVAFLYCNYKKYKEQSAIDFLSVILKHLVQGLPSIPDTVQALYFKHKQLRSRPSFDDISMAIHNTSVCYPEVFIVVDALDECLDEHRIALLSKLKILQAYNSNVRLMVTSRSIITINQEFETAACLMITAHEEDIQIYVEGQIPRLAHCVSRQQDLKRLVISAISSVSDGMFLLAKLLLDSLVGETNPRAIKSALGSMGKGSEALFQAYKDAIDRIENQTPGHCRLAKRALSWISCAKRPLSSKELQHALAIEIGDRQFDDESITDISDIVSVCAGLVTVDGQSDVVRLVHKTTQEYFDKMGTSIFPTAQEDIAMTCITYLSFDAFETGACLDKTKFTARLESYALYEYAARNWGHHARTTLVEEGELTFNFLSSEAKMSASMEAIISYSELLHYVPWIVPRQVTGMHLAAYFGLRNTLTVFLKTGHNPCHRDSGRDTPLGYATKTGQDEIVRQLLATNYVYPESKDVFGRTPLFRAAQFGHEAVVRSLLARDDVNPDSRSNNQQTPLSCAAQYGHESVVKLLLSTDGVNPNSKDSDERTPLSYAAMNNHRGVMKLLLARGDVDPNSRDSKGFTPLFRASWSDVATVKLLLAKDGVDPDPKDTNDRTPLFYAAQIGQKEIIQLLLTTKGVNPDSRDERGRTSLSYAVMNGKKEAVKLLLAEDRIDPDSRDANGRTPLSHAADCKNVVMVKLLLAEDRVDPDSKDANGRTPLSHVVEGDLGLRGIEMIQLLLTEDRIDPDSKDANGQTPLSHAAANGQAEAVILLLAEDRVDPDSKDANGRTPLSHAAANGRAEAVILLLAEDRVDPDSKDANGRTPLSYAAERDNERDIELVELLLTKDRIDPDSKDANGRTPLSHAAEIGKRKVVKLLLAEDRIDPDSKDANDRTPLSRAAEKGKRKVVKLLLAEGSIDPDFKDVNGRTPLSYAAENGHVKTAKLLLADDRVDPMSRDTDGCTPLSRAVEKGQLDVARLLLQKAISNRIVRMDGQALLSWAAEKWYHEIVEALTVRDEISANLAKKHHWTRKFATEKYIRFAEALFGKVSNDAYSEGNQMSVAVGNWHEAVVRLLLASKRNVGFVQQLFETEMIVKHLFANDDFDPDFRDASGRSLLWWAARNGNEAVVRFLLAKEGVNPDSKDVDSRTPILYAAKNGHVMVVRLLLMRKDVNPDAKDKYGLTPLMLAAWQGHESVARLLLSDHRVEPNSQDVDGRTPLSHAAENGHEMIVQLLLARDEIEPDSMNKHGLTPLSLAARQSHEEVIKLLLDEDGVNPNLGVGTCRQTPLHIAALNGHSGVVDLLLTKDNVNPDPKDNENRTPLWAAAYAGHRAVAALLLAANGVDLNARDNRLGWTPLIAAANNGHDTVVDLLLAQESIESDPKDARFGRTPLSRAARKGHIAVVALLVARDDVNLNSRDAKGRTPLSWAAGNGHLAVVKLLIAKDGVELDSRDAKGRTPLSWATEKRNLDVAGVLEVKRYANLGCRR